MCLSSQAQELSEAGVKVGLLEKKVESADVECEKKVAVEREEQQRLKDVMDEQERWVELNISVNYCMTAQCTYMYWCERSITM